MGPALAIEVSRQVEIMELKERLRQFYDVIGVQELESELRSRITDYLASSSLINERRRKGSYNLLSEQTDISHTFIWKFHTKEQAICITNMNKLANFFGVKYFVDNF